MRKQYSNIFIPTVDVYGKSGARVLDELDRAKVKEVGSNLLVLPYEFFNQLSFTDDFDYGGNLENFLSALDNITSEKSLATRIKTNKDKKTLSARLASYSSGMDVLFVTENCPLKNLAEFVDKTYSPKNKSIVVSSDSHLSVKYRNMGLSVEKPSFLIGDVSIVRKGTLSGSSELHAILQKEKSRSISIDIAKKYFDKNTIFSNNTIVRFTKYDYGIVRTPMERNRMGELFAPEPENLTLELLGEHEKSKELRFNNWHSKHLFNIPPRDMLQYIALQHALFNPDVSMVYLLGGIGSGKTLLAYVAGLTQILEYSEEHLKRRGWTNPFRRSPSQDGSIDSLNKLQVARKFGRAALYDNFILLKPNDSVGGARRDPGTLPGDLYKKQGMFLEPYNDAHKLLSLYKTFSFKDLLLHPTREEDYGPARAKEINDAVFDGGKLPGNKPAFEMTTISYFQGRSLENTFLLIDEAQLFTPEEMKVITGRLGVGSKAVIMGDPASQTFGKYCTPNRNGIVQSLEHFISKPYTSLIYLEGSYRSEISKDTRIWNP